MPISTGTYIIYNRVLSPMGEKLAITFNGSEQGVTVTALSSDNAAQHWIIGSPSNEAQPFSPTNSPSLQAAGSDDGVVVLPAWGYIWSIQNESDGFTIKDGKKIMNWNIQSATVGSKVAIKPDLGSENYRWIIERVHC